MVQSTVDVFLAEADEADGDIAFWDTPGTTFVLGEADMAASITVNTIREELTALNSDFGLENPLVVNVVSCGEPNAPPPWMPHRRARTP
jgi:hypothetical protein